MKTLFGRALLVGCLFLGCDHGDDDVARAGRSDDRLIVHAVVSSSPTVEGIAYVRAVTDVYDRADAARTDVARIAALRGGLALPVPAGFGEGDVLRLELATALCETLAGQPEGLPAALDVLEPMLRPTKSLPLDRVTARALVTFGNTARDAGDDARAVASYARGIRIMSMLRQELMQ